MVLPRFKLEQNYDLIENLKEMGLTDMFQESGDFSGMTSEKVFMNWVRLQYVEIKLSQGCFLVIRPPWNPRNVHNDNHAF